MIENTVEIYSEQTFDKIRTKSNIGRYLMRAGGNTRRLPGFQDLVFVPRPFRPAVRPEEVNTRVKLGDHYAERPLNVAMPIIIAPMSYGALSKPAKIALAKGSTMADTCTSTGEGGMMPEERAAAKQMIYQCLPGRYGWNIRDMLRADGLELLISQGAKPGMGGHLMAEKLTEEIARIRGLPMGIDLRSPSRHPDILGADDLIIKIEEFREATDWKIPVSLKLAMGRIKDDIRIAVNDKADMIQLDGQQGSTGAAPDTTMENLGIPTMCGLADAVHSLHEMNWFGQIDIVVMGGIRNGADAAKAIAMGANAVSVGMGVLMAMGCVACLQCFTGKCHKGIATQDPNLTKLLDIDEAAEGVYNYLTAMNEEIKVICASLGKRDIRELNRDDLQALTIDVSAMTGLSLVGTDRVY